MAENQLDITDKYSSLYDFDIPAKRATCKLCNRKYVFEGRQTGYKNLAEHYESKHADAWQIFQGKRKSDSSEKTSQITKYFKSESKSTLPTLKRIAIATCCSRHVLPFTFFEDPYIKWATGISGSHNSIRENVESIAKEIKDFTNEKLSGNDVIIAYDGWKNTVSAQKHLSFILHEVSGYKKPIYWKSFVMDGQSSDDIQEKIFIVINELKELKIRVVGIISDNAPACQAANRAINSRYAIIIALKCGAHTVNLIIKKGFEKVPQLISALKLVKKYVEDGLIKRYVDPRWYSRIQRMQELVIILKKDENPKVQEIARLETAITILKPFVSLLNYVQMDSSNWEDTVIQFEQAIDDCKESGYNDLAKIAESYRPNFMNPVVLVLKNISGFYKLEDSEVYIS